MKNILLIFNDLKAGYIYTQNNGEKKMVIFLEVRFFLICNFLFIVDGQLLQDAKQLHLDLLTGYMKNVFPINNQSEVMKIDINFFLFSVNAFREVEERISVTGGISMSWTDVSLSWDPALYGGITINGHCKKINKQKQK